jgi:hypothetical protein
MDYDLGYIDLEERTLQPLDNPFWPKIVTYVTGTFCYLCVRAGQIPGRSIPATMSLQHRAFGGTTNAAIARSETSLRSVPALRYHCGAFKWHLVWRRSTFSLSNRPNIGVKKSKSKIVT